MYNRQKLGLTTASVYLSRFPGDKVGEENEIPVSAILLPDFSHISQQERLNQMCIRDSVGTGGGRCSERTACF